MKKQFLILFAFISVLALSQVPQRFNKVIVTGDITSPKFIKTGSNADSVLLGNGSARSVTSLKTDTVNLSNRINAKATGNGTANGTNTGDETLTSIKTKLGAATSVSDGYLKYQDFALLHTPTTVTASNGLSISGQNISLQNASSTQSGALTFNDWNTFNSKEPAITKNTAFNKNFGTTAGTVLAGRTFGTAANSAVGDFQPAITGLTANYIPKWNGSSMVNSLISELGNSFILPGFQIYPDGSNIVLQSFSKDLSLNNQGNVVRIPSTYASTSPTTGALVVGGGIGADHVRANNFYGNGSNLTGVQLPITLTTNGTSGAATFSGNVLNVPNYTSSGSFIQNQSASAQSGSLWVSGNIISNDKIEGITISTERVDINTSGAQINFYGTSGSGVLSQPFRGLNYKKVMIYLANFVGNNNINYLTAFTYPPAIVITDGLSSSLITSKSTTSVTITSASSATGILILEGY